MEGTELFSRHIALIIAGYVLMIVALAVGVITGISNAGWVMGVMVGVATLAVGSAIIVLLAMINIGSSFKEADKALREASRLMRR